MNSAEYNKHKHVSEYKQ